MGPNDRREREKHEVRERILEAARELFVTEGIEAVTMRKVAERIEYSATAIYAYFEDKDALLREVCDRDFLLLAQTMAELAGVGDPVDRLHRAGVAYLQFAAHHPNAYRLLFMTAGRPCDPKTSRLERGNPREDAYSFLRFIVQDLIAQGKVRPEFNDADLLAQMLWGSLHGIVALHVVQGNDAWIEWRPLETTAQALMDTLVRGIAREG